MLSETPALPGSGAFILMPLAAVHAQNGPTPVNMLLLTGAGIDRARLSAVVRDMIPGGITTARSDVLIGLTGAPLQHGAFVLFALALVAAAGLGLAVMLLELALGAAEREATLARLATMGLGERQRARVVALEVLPAVAAARGGRLGVRDGAAPRGARRRSTCRRSRDRRRRWRSHRTWPRSRCRSRALVAVAIAGLAIEIRSGRRRRVAASLRAGG